MTSPLTYHDQHAEQTILGVLIQRPELAHRYGVTLDDLDELHGHHLVLNALLDQAERGIPGSFTQLVADLTTNGHLDRVGDGTTRGQAYLFHLRTLGQQAIANDAEVARQQIKVATVRRQVAQVGTRLGQAASSPDPDDMLTTASELSLALQMAVDDNGIEGDRPLPGLRSVAELLAQHEEPIQWIVPGLLARTDKVILVASEGAGKSVLSRQVGACVAAGMHPFFPAARYTPGRVLLVDLENPVGIVRRNLRTLVDAVGGLDAIADRYHVWNWPSGLDVRSPSGKSLLVRAIEQTRPDLLVIGPLYKMAEAKTGESYEEQAAKLSKSLDSIKTKYDVALWIEHHMPKASNGGTRSTPFGASLWMRWPEFGLKLEEPEENVYTLGRFRGDREQRHWPDALVRGVGRLMWSGMYEDAAVEHDIRDVCQQQG